MKRTITFSALAILLVFVSSCVDREDEIWVNGDGSFKVKCLVSVDESVARTMEGDNPFSPATVERNRAAAAKDAGEHGHRLEEYSLASIGGKAVLTVIYSGSLGDISKGEEHSAVGGLGKFVMTELDDKFRWSMTLNPVPDKPGEPVNAEAASERFQNHVYKVKAHFGKDILSTNGTLDATGKNIVEWRFPMASVAQQPPELEATFSKTSFSWGLIIGGLFCGGLVLVGGGAGVAAILWSMSRKAKASGR